MNTGSWPSTKSKPTSFVSAGMMASMTIAKRIESQLYSRSYSSPSAEKTDKTKDERTLRPLWYPLFYHDKCYVI